MIVPQQVLDEFDQVVKPSRTYLRYEVELAFVPDPSRGGVKTLRLASEMLKPLPVSSNSLFAAYPHLRDAVRGKRLKPYLIREQVQDGRARVISVPRETQGRPRQISTEKSQRTVLSAMASAEYPTLLAARAEMASWRFVALEPSAMRAADTRMETRSIDSTGAHIPATLHRRRSLGDDTVLDRLAQDVGALVDLRSLRVVEDEVGQTLELRAQVGDAPEVAARSLSDGTLRFLALAAMKYAEPYVGLLSMEEPENGIHPAKIAAMLDLLLQLSSPDEHGLRQVLVNTHSPYLVQTILQRERDAVLVAQSWRRREESGEYSASTSFHPLTGTWRARAGQAGSAQPVRSQAPLSDSKLFAFLINPSTEAEPTVA